MADVIVTTLRLLGQSTYVRGMHAASRSVRELDAAGTDIERSQKRMSGSLLAGGAAAGALRGAAMSGGAALATLAGGAAFVGLKFDATTESSQLLYKELLGSGRQAKRLVADLQALAQSAAFSTLGFQDLLPSVNLLVSSGIKSRKEILKTTKAFGAVASAANTGGEGIYGIARAFGQMRGLGRLTAEELNQFTENSAGLISADRIAKQMGITVKELRQRMEEGKVSSKEAGAAIVAAAAEFQPAAKAMGTSFTGQLNMMKESAQQTLGILFKPLFTVLRRDVFPWLNKIGQAIRKWARQGGVQRLIAQLREVWQEARPIRQVIGAVGRAIIWTFKTVGLPLLRFAITSLKIQFAVLNTVARAYVWVGNAAADAFDFVLDKGRSVINFIRGMQKKIASAAGGMWDGIKKAAEPVFNFIIDKLRWIIGKVKWVLDKAGAIADILPDISLPTPGLPGVPFLQRGTRDHRGGLAVVGEAGPELINIPRGASVTPLTKHAIDMTGLGGKTRFHFEIPVIMDGKQITRVVADRTANDVARTPHGSGYHQVPRRHG